MAAVELVSSFSSTFSVLDAVELSLSMERMLLSDSFLSKYSAFAADEAVVLGDTAGGGGGISDATRAGFWALELVFRPLILLELVGVELALPEGLSLRDEDPVEDGGAGGGTPS